LGDNFADGQAPAKPQGLESGQVGGKNTSRLRFNFGFLLEAAFGTRRTIELAYPSIVAEELTLAPLTGSFEATRNSKGIYVSGTLRTSVEAECSRCLDSSLMPVELLLDDLFFYPPWSAPPGELVVGEDGFIDLAPLVRQLSLLAVPMQPICRDDCLGLCIECGQNLNDGDCGCEADPLDPRLAPLKSLLDQQE
jgi:uncharacterized protein